MRLSLRRDPTAPYVGRSTRGAFDESLRASVCRVIYRAPLGSQQSCREGPGRSIVQFERETVGTDPSASGEFWQGRSAGANHSENQPRDTGGDDRHDAISRKLFHEQISEIGSY